MGLNGVHLLKGYHVHMLPKTDPPSKFPSIIQLLDALFLISQPIHRLTSVMHDSDSGIGSGISQFFAGIRTGIKKTQRYWNWNRNQRIWSWNLNHCLKPWLVWTGWNRNWNQRFRVGIGMESVSFLLESEPESYPGIGIQMYPESCITEAYTSIRLYSFGYFLSPMPSYHLPPEFVQIHIKNSTEMGHKNLAVRSNVCKSGICIGDGKYLNEYMPY